MSELPELTLNPSVSAGTIAESTHTRPDTSLGKQLFDISKLNGNRHKGAKVSHVLEGVVKVPNRVLTERRLSGSGSRVGSNQNSASAKRQ